MFKVKHTFCSRLICNLFQASNHTCQLKQTDFALPRFNTVTYGKHSSRYLESKLWSNLSTKERLASDPKAFKSEIRRRDLSSLLKDGYKMYVTLKADLHGTIFAYDHVACDF